MKPGLFHLLVIPLFIAACQRKTNDIHHLTFKWNATLNEAGAQICEDCEVNTPECCNIVYQGKKYIKSTSYALDTNGKISRVYSYHVPLGVNIYTVQEYLSQGHAKAGWFGRRIYWHKEQNVIVDNGTLVQNFEIVASQKRIYVKNNNTLTVYEFE